MPKRHRPGVSASSVLRHVEEVVLATSGEDAFEIVFAVAAARMNGAVHGQTRMNGAGNPRGSLRRAIADAARRYPTLEVDPVREASDELLVRVDELLKDAASTAGSPPFCFNAAARSA